MLTKFTRLRRVAAAFVVAASALLGGCATYPDSYYYGDARDGDYYRDGGDYYYDEPYRAVDYCCHDYYSGPYWTGGWYYSALWPVYSRWYDPWYYPGYYYGVTYFPRTWYGFSLSFFDYDPWWYSHHYSPYRYSWYDNYYAWHHHTPDRIGRHNYNHFPTYRFGSARAEAERLAARSRGVQQASFGVGGLQRPGDDSWVRAAERTRVREAGGRGRDVFSDTAAATQRYGARTAATTATPSRDGYRYDGRPTGDARRPTAERAYGARDADGQVSRYGGVRSRDVDVPVTRDDARMSSRPMDRTSRGWSAGPRDDTPVDRSAYRARGVPEPSYRERAQYGRASVPAYSTPERVMESPRRVYSRDRDDGHPAPQRDYGRYPAPRDQGRYQEAPQRDYGRYQAPQGGYGRDAAPRRDYDSYAAPRGSYAPPAASYDAPRGSYSAPSRSSGGGWSAPSGGGGHAAPAPSAPSRSDSGSRGSSERGSIRGRDED